MDIKRLLEIDLPAGQSAFLWGPRKAGKTTYLKKRFPQSLFLDFLDSETLFRYQGRPYLLREQVEALYPRDLKSPIIIDEVQKNPQILNDIHWIIENLKPAHFILCGSSARQIKKASVNLLGGRAWRFDFTPLIYPELPEFDLKHIFKTGLIPTHFLGKKYIDRHLKAYIYDYLTQEIQAESAIRNIRAFSKFLDIMAFSHGEMINYSNIARDCAVDSKTIKSYFEILEDMLVGDFVFPFADRKKRNQLSSHPKFYLFDVGVANFIAKREIKEMKGADAGKAFEHYVFTELQGYKKLKKQDLDINYWRTKSGHEVDFVLNEGQIAIECKISNHIQKKDLTSLIAFAKEFPESELSLVCTEEKRRVMTHENLKVTILPIEDFLKQLWAGKIT